MARKLNKAEYTAEEKKEYVLRKKEEFNRKILDELQRQLLSAKAGTLADTFQYAWERGVYPVNGFSNHIYRGINRILCNFRMNDLNSLDPRFYTGKQIYQLDKYQNEHLKIKEGQRGNTLQIEYWYVFDQTDHVAVKDSADQKQRLDDGHLLVWRARYSDVYNACQIDGLEPYNRSSNDRLHDDIETDQMVWNIAEGMDVRLFMDQDSRAFYDSEFDEIHVPERERFKTSAGCNHVCFHELAHASGHPKRLNLNLGGIFGDEAYAFEELRAEISSCLLIGYTKEGLQEREFDNTSAYLDSWLSAVKDRPNDLIRACRMAAATVDYMLEKGGYAESMPDSEIELPE